MLVLAAACTHAFKFASTVRLYCKHIIDIHIEYVRIRRFVRRIVSYVLLERKTTSLHSFFFSPSLFLSATCNLFAAVHDIYLPRISLCDERDEIILVVIYLIFIEFLLLFLLLLLLLLLLLVLFFVLLLLLLQLLLLEVSKLIYNY